MKVKKNTLFLLAAIVWTFAGINVLKIGILAYKTNLEIFNFALSILIFFLFSKFVFLKLVKKHTTRIDNYKNDKQLFINFFDLKSFLIMAFMISLGIFIRKTNAFSEQFIAFFYTGIGASLLMAGLAFGKKYIERLKNNFVIKKGEQKMKRYINLAFIYSILALVAGVFYREFTKFNNFSEKTTLSIIHTHYFVLGMIFFILLLLFEKNFKFTNKKTEKVVITYNIGLNITTIAFLIRGITQVLKLDLTKAYNASISGLAGIGHILLGISLVYLIFLIKKEVDKKISTI